MIIAILVVLGLSLGSFVNALVWRLHEQSKPAKQQAASKKDLSISQGRSMCPHCKHTLGPMDLVPVVSWVLLKGRCRYCRRPISPQYPIIEALTAILFVVSYIFWPLNLQAASGVFILVIWLIALVFFMAMLVYDIRWMILPDKLTYPLIGLSIIKMLVVVFAFDGGAGYLLRSVLAAAVAGGIFFVLYQASKGTWIGGGDVKLGYALGFLLAKPELAFLMLFAASLIGVLVALPGLITKRRELTSKLPFGPYLIAATIIVYLFGQPAINWYTGLFLA